MQLRSAWRRHQSMAIPPALISTCYNKPLNAFPHRPFSGTLIVDDQTIAAARGGNREAQARLLRELQDPWYRLTLSLLRDPERAMDATQESALRFLRQLPGFRGDS